MVPVPNASVVVVLLLMVAVVAVCATALDASRLHVEFLKLLHYSATHVGEPRGLRSAVWTAAKPKCC